MNFTYKSSKEGFCLYPCCINRRTTNNLQILFYGERCPSA